MSDDEERELGRDPLLTVAEVAQLLKLNDQTVYNWIHDGDLPAVEVGKRRMRIRRRDLHRFIHEGPAGEWSDPPPGTDWTRLATAFAHATATAQGGGDARDLAGALEDLADAARDLAAALRHTT